MPMYREDKQLAKRILSGDKRAFDAFFDDNFARLYRFASARLGDNAEAAKEVTQSTLVKALRRMSSYRAEAAMFTWLCAICRNEIGDWCRRNQRYEDHIVLVEDLPEAAGPLDSWHRRDEHRPEDAYQRTELARLIQVALDRLPTKYGDVLEWKYVEGHSVREIAARLGVGTEAAQSLLARAKRAFADVYGGLEAVARRNEGFEKS
ncbi:MAG: RNA polymerase sigma factor [Pseudomonadota bacterium]